MLFLYNLIVNKNSNGKYAFTNLFKSSLSNPESIVSKYLEYEGRLAKTNSELNYDIKDYVETVPVVFNGYSNVYSKINVSRVTLKDLDNNVIKSFMDEEDKLIEYITTYYNEINNEVENYIPSNEVSSSIKMQINGAILSIYYELDFNLDKNIYSNIIKAPFQVLLLI